MEAMIIKKPNPLRRHPSMLFGNPFFCMETASHETNVATSLAGLDLSTECRNDIAETDTVDDGFCHIVLNAEEPFFIFLATIIRVISFSTAIARLASVTGCGLNPSM